VKRLSLHQIGTVLFLAENVVLSADPDLKQFSQQRLLVDAQLREPSGNPRDGTIHFLDQVTLGTHLLPGSHVPIPGQQLHDLVNPGFQGLSENLLPASLQVSLPPLLKNVVVLIFSIKRTKTDQEIHCQLSIISLELFVPFFR
jgi:hypothetical protein